MVGVLLAFGADADKKDEDDATALSIAAQKGHVHTPGRGRAVGRTHRSHRVGTPCGRTRSLRSCSRLVHRLITPNATAAPADRTARSLRATRADLVG
jgi:hypothetical protein